MDSEIKLISGCKVTTTLIPWCLTEFNFTKRRRDTITFDNVSSTQHSCKFNFSFKINSEPNSNYPPKSLLQVELCHNSELASKFFVTAYLEKNAEKHTCITQSVNLSSSTCSQVLRFFLPTLESHQYSSLTKFVENDALTIYIRVEEYADIRKIVDDQAQADPRVTLQPDTFSEFYKNQAFVDVLFIVGPTKQHFHAHAVILAAVCPYFSSMLNGSNMIEQTTRTVDLSADTDVSVEVFQGFLDYIYGIKKVGEMNTITKGLAVLADKYNFSELRQACDKMLCDSLNKDNAVSLLQFAYHYKFELLRKKALNFAVSCGLNSEISELLGDLISSLST